MSRPALHRARAYGLALLFTAVALAIRLLLNPWLGTAAPFSFFVIAVIISAWFGGLGPGLTAGALSLLSAQAFFDWSHSVWPSNLARPLSNCVFAGLSIGVSFLAEARLRAVAQNNRLTGALRALAGELTHAEQRERRRLAHLLHDDLQQLLIAASMRFELLTDRVRADGVTKDEVEELHAILQQCVSATRSMSIELSPPILYDSGLAPALEWLGQWMRDKHKLEVHVVVDGHAEPRGEDMRVFLFQATKELLFNVVKHAGLTHARVRLDRLADDRLQVTVEDDGRGFDAAGADHTTTAGGFGLFSIRQRLRLFGGRLEMTSEPGRGACVRLVMPLDGAKGSLPIG